MKLSNMLALFALMVGIGDLTVAYPQALTPHQQLALRIFICWDHNREKETW